MQKLAALLLLLLTATNASAYKKTPTEEAAPIVAEGKRLYKSEMASWYGTDLFLASYNNQENIGGYFSYSDRDIAKCVFFSKAGKVIGTISFDSTYNTKTADVNLTERDFTKTEQDLYEIRAIALQEMMSDTLFQTYENTQYNIIPLINGKDKKVYVLTGPQQSGVVIFGNDYLLTFDQNNKLRNKKSLHKNIIVLDLKEKEAQNAESAVHSHLPETGDFITATDICTLMLYEKFTIWKTHHVVSAKYLNIWNCETNELLVMPMETIKKIYEE